MNDGPRRVSPFLALRSHERAAIERKLGIQYASGQSLGALDAAAQAFVEQGRAFVRITAQEGFAVAPRLEPDAARAALVLTYSGSLLLCGAPEPPKGRRRFVYQSIDAASAPREGTFTLVEAIRVDHAVVGSRLKTSPVRSLSVAVASRDWELGRRTLSHLSATLGQLDSGPIEAVDVGGVRSVFVQDAKLRLRNDELGKDMANAETELAALLARLVGSKIEDDPLEAEIIGLVLFIGTLGVERGHRAVPATRVRGFDTISGETCAIDKAGVLLRRPGAPVEKVDGGAIAGDAIVPGAPAAVVDRRGRLVAVLGRVRNVDAR